MSTVHIPAKVKAEVESKLRECIAIAENKFGQKFKFPTVKYDKRGSTAGTANIKNWSVNFNSVLLMENLTDFINRTVPHEMAHLVDFKLNPENFESGLVMNRYGRIKRTKRDVHGSTWKSIMVLFGAPVSRCHSYDVSNASVKKRTSKHVYVCQNCGTKMELGPKRHSKMARGVTNYWMRGCGGHTYKYVGTNRPESKHNLPYPTMPMPAAADAPAKKAKAPKSGSKMERAIKIYQDTPNASRQLIINMYMELLDMTKSGASTYYYNVKNKVG